MRSIRILGAAALAALVFMSGTVGAAAQTPDLTEEERQDLVHWWTQYDVAPATQDELLESLERGELWDAIGGSDPVNVTTNAYAGETETVERYADGSIVVTTVEVPVAPFSANPIGGVTPFTVGPCESSSTGSGYANRYDCKVFSTSGVVEMGFYMSYSLRQGGYDKITEVHSGYARATTGTIPTPRATIGKANENSSGSAFAYVKEQYKAAGGTASATVEMRGLVGKDTAWTRWEHAVPR